jgi:hypothetical protein
VLNIFETMADRTTKEPINIRDSIIMFCRDTVYLLEDYRIIAKRRFTRPNDPHSYACGSHPCQAGHGVSSPWSSRMRVGRGAGPTSEKFSVTKLHEGDQGLLRQ